MYFHRLEAFESGSGCSLNLVYTRSTVPQVSPYGVVVVGGHDQQLKAGEAICARALSANVWRA